VAEKEYIEREVTCDDCIHYDICTFHITGNDNKKCIHFKNKADVVEVRHGEWVQYWDDNYLSFYHKCSECGNFPLTKEETMHDEVLSAYCPNCGAKMDGKGEGE
jgi:hypothetical protein